MIENKHEKNKKPNVPNLRFPEFSGEWQVESIGENSNILMCKRIFANQTNLEKGVPFFKIGTIGGAPDCYIDANLFDEYRKKYNYPRKGEVLITCAGTVGKCIIFNGEDSYYQDSNIVWIDNPLQKYSNSFLYYIINNVDWNKLNSTTITRIYNDNLRELKISYPTKVEQQKIASLLSLIDERIATQMKIIDSLESLIKGLYHSLSKDKWAKQHLRDLFVVRNERNTNNHTVFSVAVEKGLVNQIEHLGRSFAAKDTSNYNVVREGDVVYTKSPTGSFPYGIIKQSYVNKPVAVSPLYGVYKPYNVYIGNILNYYFLSPISANNYLSPLVQKGAKNTINISTTHFLNNFVLLPTCEKEIEKISITLTTLNSKMQVERGVLKKLNSQKQYLLSEMFI